MKFNQAQQQYIKKLIKKAKAEELARIEKESPKNNFIFQYGAKCMETGEEILFNSKDELQAFIVNQEVAERIK